MDDIRQADYNLTAQLLDAFYCNCQRQAYYDFVELVYRVRLFLRENAGKEPPIAAIVDEMCKERNQPRRGFYGNIRSTIAPLLAADEDFWKTFGGEAPEKLTIGELAKYLARIFESYRS